MGDHPLSITGNNHLGNTSAQTKSSGNQFCLKTSTCLLGYLNHTCRLRMSNVAIYCLSSAEEWENERTWGRQEAAVPLCCYDKSLRFGDDLYPGWTAACQPRPCRALLCAQPRPPPAASRSFSEDISPGLSLLFWSRGTPPRGKEVGIPWVPAVTQVGEVPAWAPPGF